MIINRITDFIVVFTFGTFIYCPFCKSIRVNHSKAEVEIKDGIRTEIYSLTCKKCGKTGQGIEHWPE